MPDDPPDDEADDPITTAVLSEAPYDRIKALRGLAAGPETTLARLAAQLGLLALVLPIYLSFPASTAEFLPSTDPASAAPQVVVPGVFGATMTTLAAAVVTGTTLVRIRRGPLDERRARRAVDFETFAAYVGHGLGGVPIALSLAYFLLGAAGGDAVGAYVRTMDGINPFSTTPLGISVLVLSTVSFAVAVALLGVRGYVGMRLVESRSRRE